MDKCFLYRVKIKEEMFAEIKQSVNYKTDCWLLTVDLRKKLKIESSKFLQFEKKTAGAFYFCLIEMN